MTTPEPDAGEKVEEPKSKEPKIPKTKKKVEVAATS